MVDLLLIMSKKAEVCDAVKEFLIFHVDEIPVLSTLALQGIDVRAEILAHLPKDNQDDI